MSHGPHAETENKKIAIFIAILALFLAISETAGKGAQTNALSYNIEASNLWAFFQAKSIRKTSLEVAADTMDVDIGLAKDPAMVAAMEQRVKKWRAKAAQYQSEPDKGEGRKELAVRAIAAQKKREDSMAAYHHFELASGAFQIAIVLATSFIITNVLYLLWIAGGLGVIGILFTLVGMIHPHLFHIL